MQNLKRQLRPLFASFAGMLAVLLFAGCQTSQPQANSPAPAPTTSATSATPMPATAAAPAPKPADGAIRIKAGITNSLTDAEGHVWLPDQGFADGETIERPGLKIANTKSPELYLSERYSMTSFSRAVPNGKYVVKLHFAETFEDVTAAGQRVFSFNVAGHEFKDFDVVAKAGAPMTAYVQSVDVDVTNGKLDITFTANVQNPEINGIEIIPAS